MVFQFLCPHQHLLQGDESQMGQQCQCPQCGIVFIIPTIQIQPRHVQPQYSQPAQPQQETYADAYPSYTQPEPDSGIGDFLGELGGGHAPAPAAEPHYEPAQEAYEEPAAEEQEEVEDEPVDEGPEVVHIPCPNGHPLETPLDMIGQEVLCPHCAVQFRLRNEDSIEYHERQEKLLAERSRVWFNWAIAAAVLVLLGLVSMIVISMQPK